MRIDFGGTRGAQFSNHKSLSFDKFVPVAFAGWTQAISSVLSPNVHIVSRPPGIVGHVHERHVGLTRQPNEAALPGTVFCVGAAMREIRHDRADSGVNFYAHGSEPKDL